MTMATHCGSGSQCSTPMFCSAAHADTSNGIGTREMRARANPGPEKTTFLMKRRTLEKCCRRSGYFHCRKQCDEEAREEKTARAVENRNRFKHHGDDAAPLKSEAFAATGRHSR